MNTETRCQSCQRKLGELTHGLAEAWMTQQPLSGDPDEILYRVKCPRCGEINTFRFHPQDIMTN